MIISLIGMSGVGKTFWSRKLQKSGFMHLDCDQMIADCLGEYLDKDKNHTVSDLASWMGQPYETVYLKKSQIYLECEEKVLAKILDDIESNPVKNDIVIDSTGSTIYLDKKVLEKLKNMTRVIYLETSKAVQDEMFVTFLKEPKPIIWKDRYLQVKGESKRDALVRCYPGLLLYRSKEYSKLAHVSVPYSVHKSKNMTENYFLSI